MKPTIYFRKRRVADSTAQRRRQAGPLLAIGIAMLTSPVAAGEREIAKAIDLSPTVPGDPLPVTQQPAALSILRLSPGDRVKVTFYERFGAVAAGDEQVPTSELVERTELTGEYVVQLDGTIFLPLLGTVDVGRQSLSDAQRMFASVFRAATGREAKVAVVVASREPVYVIGVVSNPGTFPYTEGMTVLHAVALSDGFEGKGAELSRSFEIIRERERLEKATDRLKRLLARRVVLEAERDASQMDLKALEEVAGKDAAARLVGSVLSERELLQASRNAQKSAMEATIASAEKEMAGLRDRMEHLGASLKDRSERFDVLNTLQSKGSLSSFNLYQARSDIAAVEEREDEVKGLLTQTELKLSQASQEKMRLDVDATVELERELRDIERDISDEQLTIAAASKLLAIAGKPMGANTGTNLSFKIVRRTPRGAVEIAADELTALEAGDLVRITGPTIFGMTK